MNPLLRFTDLTSLNPEDTTQSVGAWAKKAVADPMNLPAALCVWPSMVEAVALAVGEAPVGVAAVCGGFPSGQTYMEVKLLEAALAVENGADELDTVIDLGAVLSGNLEQAAAEIEALKEEVGDEAILKVILEVGVLKTDELIYKAAMTAMEAGADFIKTSTGKTATGATPEAARVMCRAIGDYAKKSGRQVGFKAAGGIRTAEAAQQYYHIVEQELGAEWLTPALFRLGRSSI